jgi:hypothetical protein
MAPAPTLTAKPPAEIAAKRLELQAAAFNAIKQLPDEAFVTDAQCEALTGLSRTSLGRIEQSEPLLRSVKLGPKRKVRLLGNVRAFVQKCIAAANVESKSRALGPADAPTA